MSFAFTPEQADAIHSRGENLLVSAGAGSGKTTVLVERVINLLIEGCPVDRLLALTFTHAAADDMRIRVERALTALLAEQPGEARLRQQLALLPQAEISTIHSFCLNLLKRNYYRAGLPAGFKVAAEDQIEALREQVLADILEEGYADPEGGLARLADAYGGVHDDRDLAALILSLHEYSRSRPDPAGWLEQCAARLQPVEDLEQMFYVPYLRQRLGLELAMAAHSFQEAKALCLRRPLPRPWLALADEDIGQVQAISQCPSLAQQLLALRHLRLSTLPSGKKQLREGYPDDYQFDPEDLDAYRDLRQQGRKALAALSGKYPPPDPEREREQLAAIAALMGELAHITIRLDQALSREKRERGWVDYGDMEHLTLGLLSDEAVAAELRADYDQVLVDEYQDINEVQEAIFSRLRQEHNFFAVGDVKQSVYRFRLAEPRLFLDKYQAYGAGQGGRRIDLNRNYRSAPALIEGVNSLFRQLMYAEVAEVDYDRAAELIAGREDQAPPPELWLIDRDGDAEADPEEEALASLAREARLIASRAAALHEEGFAWKDMAVLLRSFQANQGVISAELARWGIPSQAAGSTDLNTSPEVLLCRALLRVLDNPRQDIYLAAALSSPIFGYKAEDLLQLRLAQPQGLLWEGLLARAAAPEGERERAVLESLDRWRQMAEERPLSLLLPAIWRESGFYHLAGAMAQGRARQARLDMLEQLAIRQELLGGGLYGLLCALEDITAPGRPALPDTMGGGQDGVRLMSIHKSKGLEFPVVFVAGCASRFNFRDQRADVIWERSLGLGARWADRKAGKKYPTLCHTAVAEKMREQALAEEMRVYYVALTRARERLILTACAPKLSRRAEGWRRMEPGEERLPLYITAKATACLDWLGPALLRPDSPAAGYWQTQLITRLPEVDAPAPAALSVSPAPSQELSEPLEAVLDFRYPQRERCQLPAKWSVSALSRLAHQAQREEAAPIEAARAEEQDQAQEETRSLFDPERAARRGTATHLLLQVIDLRRVSREDIIAQLNSLVEQGLLSAEDKALVNAGALARFFRGPVGQRLCAAGQVLRETPFTMLQEDGSLLQGVIDAAFWDGDGWVLLDYKTGGSGASDEELRDRYGQQLACYSQAIERLWRQPVREAWLCLVDKDRCLRV